MKKHLKNISQLSLAVLITNLCCSTAIFAAPQTLPQTKTTRTELKVSCPKIKEIQRSSDGTWYANNQYGSWKGLNSSFAKILTSFIGAQWQGVGVGSLICTYQTGGEMSFPVQLAYKILVRDPNNLQVTAQENTNKPTNSWKSASLNYNGQKQNLMNCASTDDSQCEFVPVLRKPSIDVNKALDNAKKNYKTPFSANL